MAPHGRLEMFVCLLTIALAPLSLSAGPDAGSSQAGGAMEAGSVWAGYITGDERRVGRRDREVAARLRVIERTGDDFVAELNIRARQGFALRMAGTVKKDQLVAKVTTIVRGAWPHGTVGDVWTGQVRGDELVLQHTSEKKLTTTATLARQQPPQRGRG